MQLVFFRLYLVLHTCAARFDVTGTAQNFLESKEALIWITLFVEPIFQAVVIKWSLAYGAAVMGARVLGSIGAFIDTFFGGRGAKKSY